MRRLIGILTFAAWAATGGTPVVRDIDGRELTPLTPSGAAFVLFFITHDCPISNYYAPEIQRMCSEYKSKGVGCALVYIDPTLDSKSVRQHLTEYRYGDIPAILDRSRALVGATHATVTPEAVVVAHGGAVAYRGRIDNAYASLGKPRRQVTQRDLRAALDAILAGKSVAQAETSAVGCGIPPLNAYTKD